VSGFSDSEILQDFLRRARSPSVTPCLLAKLISVAFPFDQLAASFHPSRHEGEANERENKPDTRGFLPEDVLAHNLHKTTFES